MTTLWTIKTCSNTSCTRTMPSNPAINTKCTELYIPSNTLPYGIYNFTLTVSVPGFSTVSSVLIDIVRSPIVVNLVQLGTLMITRGHQQDLLINPGAYSFDPDGFAFNTSVGTALLHIYRSLITFSTCCLHRNGPTDIFVESMV